MNEDIFMSSVSWNKLSQAWWLRELKCLHSGSEGWSQYPRADTGRAATPRRLSGEQCLASFSCWGAAGIRWLLPKPLQSPPPSSCLLLCAGQVSLCLFRTRIQLIVLRAHKGNQGRSCHVKILNFITYPKIFYIRFPQKVTFTGSRMRTWISFGVCFRPAT